MKTPSVLKLSAVALATALTVSTALAQDSATSPAPVHLDYAATEVAKLTQAKVNDDTIIAYVNASGNLFNLNADQIIYLKQLGASDNVIKAMLAHPMSSINNSVASSGGSTATYSSVPTPSGPAPVITAPAATVVTQPVYADADTSYYSYPYYSSYPYYYSSYPYYYGYYGGGYPVSFYWGGRGGGYRGGWGGGFHSAAIGGFRGGGGFSGGFRGGGGGFHGGHREIPAGRLVYYIIGGGTASVRGECGVRYNALDHLTTGRLHSIMD